MSDLLKSPQNQSKKLIYLSVVKTDRIWKMYLT